MSSTLAVEPKGTKSGSDRGSGQRGLTDRDKAERKLGLILVAPAVTVMVLVTAYPILYSIWLSLQRYNLRFPDQHGFVGLGNYTRILGSGLFWLDVSSTLLITVISVVVELVIGLALALVMHRAVFGRRTVRTAVLVPYGIITVVAAFAFQFAVSPDLGGFVHLGTPLLTTRAGSFFTIILTEIWKTTPFMSLLLLAGLATVPNELIEAGKVDGATAWQRLFKIILPTIKSAVLVAVLFRTLDAVRIFDTVYIQTKGANKTTTMSQLGYNQLINQLNLGLGSAVSVLLFLLVILIAVIFIKGFKTDLGSVRGDR
ncbi:MAG: sugar ABC transporter permease [Mycobacteriales bacterium]